MRTLHLFTPILILNTLALPGCVSLNNPRQYTYQLDLRNASGRPVSVEFLRIEGSRVGKVRCDLADGGFYTHRYSTWSSAEYLEARLRYLDPSDSTNAPVWISEIPVGATRADIISKDGRLTLQERSPK